MSDRDLAGGQSGPWRGPFLLASALLLWGPLINVTEALLVPQTWAGRGFQVPVAVTRDAPAIFLAAALVLAARSVSGGLTGQVARRWTTWGWVFMALAFWVLAAGFLVVAIPQGRHIEDPAFHLVHTGGMVRTTAVLLFSGLFAWVISARLRSGGPGSVGSAIR